MTRRHLIVSGRVQGVFYRDSVRERAEAEGVAGWVANRDDGTVEAVFEGDESAVEAVVAFCREGPSHADVDDVDVREEEPEGLDGFRIR